MSEDGFTLYRNTSNHQIGVVKINEWDNRPSAIPLDAGQTVYLSEVEKRLTRNAPAKAEDNPLANGDLSLVDESIRAETLTPVVVSEPEPNTVSPEPSFPSSDGKPDPALPSGALPAGQEFPPTPMEADLAAEEKARQEEQEGKKVQAIDQSEEHAAVEEHQQETGAAVDPKGQAEEGEFAQAEEVATPTAPSKPAPKRSRSKK